MEKGREQRGLTVKLVRLLEQHKDKRVVVVGASCTGKSTFLKAISFGVDMDEVLWPQLTEEEKAYADSDPWTPEVGEVMDRWAKERVLVNPGYPVFGTIVLDADLIVYLIISDELLKERVALRGAKFENVKNMQKQINDNVRTSGLPLIEFHVG